MHQCESLSFIRDSFYPQWPMQCAWYSHWRIRNSSVSFVTVTVT